MSSLSLLLLYPLGWLAAISQFIKTANHNEKLNLSLNEKFLLWLIYLVPMGKLIYFNIPNLMGFKFSFLIWSAVCIFTFGSWFSLKLFNFHRFLIFGLLLFFPIISLILRGDYSDLLYYSGDEQSDSLGARLASLIFLMMFSLAVLDLCLKYGYGIVIRSFLDGVVTAVIIGCLIFILVYAGFIGVSDLMPISADTHIVDIIYRFNPGGNVNEFGLISIYALLMFRLGYPKASTLSQYLIYGLLLFALFFSLTRAAWLAYGGALFAMALISGRGRKILIFAIISFAVLVFIVYQLNDDFANIVLTRFAFEGGASGDERLDKLETAFFSTNVSIWKILFGYGWATNLYLHSVPLQLIYEIGIAGYLLFSAVMAWSIIKLIIRIRNGFHSSLPIFGCLVAFSINSTLHHTLYHMQTWFLLGLVTYFSFSPKSLIRY